MSKVCRYTSCAFLWNEDRYERGTEERAFLEEQAGFGLYRQGVPAITFLAQEIYVSRLLPPRCASTASQGFQNAGAVSIQTSQLKKGTENSPCPVCVSSSIFLVLAAVVAGRLLFYRDIPPVASDPSECASATMDPKKLPSVCIGSRELLRCCRTQLTSKARISFGAGIAYPPLLFSFWECPLASGSCTGRF